MIDKSRNDRPSARPKPGEKPFRGGDDKPRRPKKGPDPIPGGVPAGTVAKRPDEAQRIAKAMARSGLCSRRDAEMWIGQGRVEVNGVQLTSPAFNVNPGDRILVDGVALASRERTRLFAFHKPRGFVTTDRDPEGRPTIFDHLATVVPINTAAGLPRVVTIGRLDINTEGLLLLTNDGGLARVLELPSTGWLRRYRVRANGATDQSVLDKLREGVTIDGIDYIGIEAHLDRVQGANVWLTMGLREGKNREIKRVLEHIGLAVTRLIRVSFGPFQLGELEEGGVEEIKSRILRDQLGDKLAAEAGADFDSPLAGEEPLRAARPRKSVAVETPEQRERPEAPRRKHVSALRAEKGRDETAGPRTRVERSGTEDRKGRAVKVERVVAAKRGKFEDVVPDSRNARRFEQERKPPREEGERKFRAPPRGDGGRTSKPRGDKPAGERTFRTPPREGAERKFKPRADKPEGERTFRSAPREGGERPARAKFRDGLETRRGERGGPDPKRFDRSMRGKPADAPREERAPRQYDNSKRPPREDGGGKPGGFKAARRFAPGGKPFTDRGSSKGPRKPGGARPPRKG